MFDSLKPLGNRGPKVAVAPAPAAAPAVVTTPVVNAASVQSLHADPYQDLKRFSDPKIKPVVIPAPSVAAPKTVPTEQPAAVALPAGIIPLTDPAGVVRGYLNRDGAFVLATLEKSNTSLDHLSEHDR